MSKNKKEDLIIDAVSGIDEDIVDKNLKKRFELWCKKGAKRFSMLKIAAIAACVALLATFIVVILPLIPTGQIPVYQGMTVSNEAPVINTESHLHLAAGRLPCSSKPIRATALLPPL